jgi:hypothetical protein
MRPERCAAAAVATLLHRQRIATMDELKAALGTTVDMTVFRKLRVLGYHSSYSHRRRFYTLAEIAAFDADGLWSYRDVHFSRFGSLVKTIEELVRQAAMGLSGAELRTALHVAVKQPLRQLVRAGAVVRAAMAPKGAVYCHPDPRKHQEQLQLRQAAMGAAVRGTAPAVSDETAAALLLFFSTLDEHQRRLYAGLEALRVGRGGDQWIARLTGLDVHTVARGRRELLARDQHPAGGRRPGAGRPRVEKKRRTS